MSQSGFLAPGVSSGAAILDNPAPRARAIGTLKHWIVEGVLEAGMPLPAERRLAERLGVPRATVSRALDALEREGLVRTVGGRTRVVVAVNGGAEAGGTLVRQAVVLFAPSLDPAPHHLERER